MGRQIVPSVALVLVFVGVAWAIDKDITVITGKFQSYKDGTLKVEDMRTRRVREFHLDDDTAVVSVVNTKEKLPLATAFDGVEPGRILRVFVKGNTDDAKVEAVQIGQGSRTTLDRPRPGGEDLTKTKAKYVVTAEELFQEHKEDKKAAEAKYANQVVEVRGIVAGIGKNIAQRPFVDLKVPKQFVGVMCFTADKEPWAEVVPGQKVTLKGRWPRGAFGPQLENCVIIDKGESTAITVSVQDLLKDVAAKPAAAQEKYDNKWLIMDGVVADSRINDKGGFWELVLKGEGDARIICGFGTHPEALRGIRTGQRLRVVGQALVITTGKPSVTLSGCQAITQKR
jgi:hypothetical protein